MAVNSRDSLSFGDPRHSEVKYHGSIETRVLKSFILIRFCSSGGVRYVSQTVTNVSMGVDQHNAWAAVNRTVEMVGILTYDESRRSTSYYNRG